MQQNFKLWESCDVDITFYPSLVKFTDAAMVIFPGGGYVGRAAHEGEGYAQLINTFGMNAFVVNYRVYPNMFPLPLLDARRAIRFIRHNAESFEISKDKILVMGSSAGGHLAALVSTFSESIDGEGIDTTDSENYVPNGQVLCYPVITENESLAHIGSYKNLLGDLYPERDRFSPELLVSDTTPKAFIWHTADDSVVNVINSYKYAEALSKHGIPHELHVFPYGPHGLGVSASLPHVAQWTQLLRNWLTYNGFLN